MFSDTQEFVQGIDGGAPTESAAGDEMDAADEEMPPRLLRRRPASTRTRTRTLTARCLLPRRLPPARRRLPRRPIA